jgi:uncharacterized membrane protein
MAGCEEGVKNMLRHNLTLVDLRLIATFVLRRNLKVKGNGSTSRSFFLKLLLTNTLNNMDTLTKMLSKFLFALPFLVFGVLHFMNLDGMSFLVPAYLPAAKVWVAITGIALIGASISIMAGIWDVWASFLLGVLLLVFALLIHLAAVMGGDQMSMSSLLKDLSLAGAAWMYSGFVAKSKKIKKG